MTTRQAVDRGLEIARRIAALKEELAAVEAVLVEAAMRGDQEPLNDPEREGRQFRAHGSDTWVPVIFEADLLAGSLKPGSPAHTRLASLAGDRFPQLYREVHSFERVKPSGKGFRSLVRELFEPAPAADIISASLARDKNGIPRSRILVDWPR